MLCYEFTSIQVVYYVLSLFSENAIWFLVFFQNASILEPSNQPTLSNANRITPVHVLFVQIKYVPLITVVVK